MHARLFRLHGQLESHLPRKSFLGLVSGIDGIDGIDRIDVFADMAEVAGTNNMLGENRRVEITEMPVSANLVIVHIEQI